MKRPSKPLFGNPTRYTENVAISATSKRIVGLLLAGGSDASTIKLTNDADGTGTAVLNIQALTRQSKFLPLYKFGGVLFSSKVYATFTGTGPVLYVWME